MPDDSRDALAAPDAGTAPRIARATVCAGATTTDYLRAGCGPTVLLLGADVDSPLLSALAARFRVIAPLPAADRAPPAPFSAWLRDFLDGLGVVGASVVAEEGWALRALRFALTDPTRVERIALLFRDAPDPALGGDGCHPELLGCSGHPLLVVCETAAGARGRACASTVDDVVRFLAGEPSVGA